MNYAAKFDQNYLYMYLTSISWIYTWILPIFDVHSVEHTPFDICDTVIWYDAGSKVPDSVKVL